MNKWTTALILLQTVQEQDFPWHFSQAQTKSMLNILGMESPVHRDQWLPITNGHCRSATLDYSQTFLSYPQSNRPFKSKATQLRPHVQPGCTA